MLTLTGKYNSARIFSDNIREETVSQIIELCNEELTQGCQIRIMPDAHKGEGCVIGTTMTFNNKVVPRLIGTDIGCGILVLNLRNAIISYPELDTWLRENVPSGMSASRRQLEFPKLEELKCIDHIDGELALLSLNLLGRGNHFIEIEEGSNGFKYLVIHAGSNSLGKQVAEYYQALATKSMDVNRELVNEAVDALIREGRESEIETVLSFLNKPKSVNKSFAYLEGDSLNDYLHDVKIVQEYAEYNRYLIAKTITEHQNINIDHLEKFDSVHNYIDVEHRILRKGAISAKRGEKLLIPINSSEGSLFCFGKGNSDWNYSAPHGAGRILSRSEAKTKVNMEEYKESMVGVYTTSVCEGTIDEAPAVYKSIEEIFYYTLDTVDLIETLRPVYNFRSR